MSDPKSENVKLHGYQIGADTWRAVRRLTAELSARPPIVHPWTGLETDLAAGSRVLGLVGYGSLMNAKSAARTVRPVSAARPVIAFGVRRVFNYIMPDDLLAKLGRSSVRPARAALNVYPSPDPGDAVNGVYIEVPLEDVPALREREKGYDLRPAACLNWNTPGGEPFVGHILCAPDAPSMGERHTDDTLQPQPEYASLCREGAASFGEEFVAFYLATTFLADRCTTVADCQTPGPLPMAVEAGER
jgi:hypothetical protein